MRLLILLLLPLTLFAQQYTPVKNNTEFKGFIKVDSNAYFNQNVGIGTTTPTNKLEVNGKFQSTTNSLMRLYTGVQTLTVGGTQYSNPSAKCLGLVDGSNYVFTNGVEKVDPNLGGGVQSVMAAFDTLNFTGYFFRADSTKIEGGYTKFGSSSSNFKLDSAVMQLTSLGNGVPILLQPNTGDGNVGIGTNTPRAKLQIYGGMSVINGTYTDGLLLINQDSAAGLVQLGDYAGDVHNTAIVIDDANQYVRISDSSSQFQTQTFTIVNLNGAAQVGINTQTPTASLEVVGNAIFGTNDSVIGNHYAIGNNNIVVGGDFGIGIGQGNRILDYSPDAHVGIVIGRDDTLKGEGIIIGTGLNSNGLQGILIGNGRFTNAFTFFKNDGSVGIGTTSPQGALDVTSTTSGIIFPRVADDTAVTSPIEGMVIYSLALHKLEVYTGSVWETITSL